MFAVGSYISGAAPIDFTADIKEIAGRPVSKRGRLPGINPNDRLMEVEGSHACGTHLPPDRSAARSRPSPGARRAADGGDGRGGEDRPARPDRPSGATPRYHRG